MGTRRNALLRLLTLSTAPMATALAAATPAADPRAGRDAQRFAADRAEVEDLQARYLFALDWQDAEAYAATFTEDGVLDWANGVVRGRAAIRAEVGNMRAAVERLAAAEAPLRPARRRHFVTNMVLSVHGDAAKSVAYWFEFYDDNPGRQATTPNYGHYEDDLRRVDGRWLYARRKIYNETMATRAAGGVNPVRERGL